MQIIGALFPLALRLLLQLLSPTPKVCTIYKHIHEVKTEILSVCNNNINNNNKKRTREMTRILNIGEATSTKGAKTLAASFDNHFTMQNQYRLSSTKDCDEETKQERQNLNGYGIGT
ncbi:hypothetical protein CAPTEDRAFT_192440 [Capitella teleta]|uniref:Uncharacterized protein n=1 Tax=Capitella teleta TaxID=283909 RepID=R7VJZ3_CAPTE|nr:hypothetical protein CAPTEDRAFT_192440 [Capitella teleta]|eukprot:ELU16330.1 hypothetical protein CAPTEDRAFT_192440 [Capitella teleta]